jgi:hypothetical protein
LDLNTEHIEWWNRIRRIESNFEAWISSSSYAFKSFLSLNSQNKFADICKIIEILKNFHKKSKMSFKIHVEYSGLKIESKLVQIKSCITIITISNKMIFVLFVN